MAAFGGWGAGGMAASYSSNCLDADEIEHRASLAQDEGAVSSRRPRKAL